MGAGDAIGIALGLGCALTFAFLISQVAVRLWDHSIQDAINAYAVKKRLREIRENARDQHLAFIHAEMVNGRASGNSGGGGTEAIGQPVRNGSHSHDGGDQ